VHRRLKVADIEYMNWTQDLVNEFWNNVDKMDQGGMSFARNAKRSLHWILKKYLSESELHLDFGAGTGEFAAHMINQGYQFAIDDPAIERRNEAKKYLNKGKNFLPFSNDVKFQYDVVTCFEVIEHVLDSELDEFISTVANRVKDGGKLILTAPNKENLMQDMVFCPISKVAFHRWQHVRSIDLDWVHGKFSRFGFDKIVGHQLDFADHLYEPFLYFLDIVQDSNPKDPMPLHIHQLKNDIDAIIGGATRLLYVAEKTYPDT